MSRQESQQRWIRKTGNGAYHSGPEHVARVKAWREAHPGYWRKPGSNHPISATRPVSPMLSEVIQRFALQDSCDALQDSWNPQLAALLGLLVWLRGETLQEAIAEDLLEIMLNGYAILEELYPSPASKPSVPTPPNH